MMTKIKVLYEALNQTMDTYKSAIIDNANDLYNLTGEERIPNDIVLSDVLQYAADICFELEKKDES